MPLKSSRGGCSSQGYSDVSKNFMLLDSAIKTTGGRRSKSAKKSSMKKAKVGKQHRRRYGGEGEGEEPQSAPPDVSSAPPPPPSASASAPPAEGSYMPPPETLGLGSAFSGVMKNLTGGKKTKSKSKKSKRHGGCIKGVNCNKAQKKGGTGVELAPFISSLVLLGLRVGNDKMLQTGVTKQLSDMVKSKSSAKKTSTKKTSTKKTTTRKTSSKLF
jgi:hypothetical protein